MINVNSVYQTVLLILNQQQRGYITPDEFNKIGTQAQLTIFEGYTSDLNQQYRTQQNDTEYANRIKNIEEKLQFFQRTAQIPYDVATSSFPLLDNPPVPIDNPPLVGTTDILYRLGSVFYRDYDLGEYVQPNELKQLILSPLTQPTEKFPIYTYENNVLKLYPTSIQSGVSISYLAKPQDVLWNFTTDPATGAYLYNAGTSIQFDLDVTEQDELIMRILAYAGVIIQDPSIIQTAAQAVANQDNNEKQ
tara:strand:- start:18 stop:761 length:744 start_codon:yes stop_codon:yes gene_type:complete